MQNLLILFLSGSFILMAISFPAMFRLLRPGSLFGVCYGAALTSPALWYEINQGAGWRIFKVGLLSSVAATVLYFAPGLSAAAYYFSCSTIMLGLLISGLIKTGRHLKSYNCL